MKHLFKHWVRYAFYAMVLLVPVTFLPWTVDVLEVNKQTMILILTSAAAIAWLGDMVVRKQFSLKKSWLFALVGLFLIAVALSSAWSLAPYTSWVGSGLQEYTSFLSLLSFGVLFIVGSHLLTDTKTQMTVWGLSLVASAIVGVAIVFAMCGIPLFPTNFIGTPNALAFYLVTMAVLGSALWLVAADKGEGDVALFGARGVVVKVSIALTAFSALAVTLALDYWTLWAAMLLGTGVMFAFALIRAQEFPSTSRFVLPMLLFVVPIVFLFLGSVVPSPFAIEVTPDHDATWALAKQTMADTSWFFGSGPGTFVFDYAKFHPADVNATTFWDVRFDRGSSHVLTMLATLGVVGTGLFLFIVLSLAVTGLQTLIKERVHTEWKMTFVAFSGWIILAFALFAYTSNMTLAFLFWLLSAVLVSQTSQKMQTWEFSRNPRVALLTSFFFVLVNVGLLTALFVGVGRYASEMIFAQAVSSHRQGADIEIVVKRLEQATSFNSRSDIYARNLAHARLLLVAKQIQNADINPADLGGLVESTILEAQRAVQLSQNNVVNYSLLGDILKELSPIAQNADMLAIQSYNAAIGLAPNNPKYQLARGQALLVRADQLSVLAESEDTETADAAETARTEALTAAVAAFQAAIDLKPDYAAAHYQLSLTYVRQGNLSDAIERMAAVAVAAPNDVGVAFQLGLLYLQQGRNDLAQVQFERAVAIAPNYSNAHWYLASVYEAEDDLEAAIAQMEIVAKLNPENVAVQARLDRMKAGPEPEEVIPEPIEEGENDPTQLGESEGTLGE